MPSVCLLLLLLPPPPPPQHLRIVRIAVTQNAIIEPTDAPLGLTDAALKSTGVVMATTSAAVQPITTSPAVQPMKKTRAENKTPISHVTLQNPC